MGELKLLESDSGSCSASAVREDDSKMVWRPEKVRKCLWKDYHTFQLWPSILDIFFIPGVRPVFQDIFTLILTQLLQRSLKRPLIKSSLAWAEKTGIALLPAVMQIKWLLRSKKACSFLCLFLSSFFKSALFNSTVLLGFIHADAWWGHGDCFGHNIMVTFFSHVGMW